MPARVLQVSAPAMNGTLRVTVLIEDFAGNTRRTFCLGAAAYEALGAPAAGTAVEDETLAALAEAEGEVRAVSRAESLLAYGDNSANGLCRKLRRRGYSQQSAEAAVGRMLQKGYIREEEQAYRLVLRDANSKLWGPRRILGDLLQKGYPAALSRSAIAQAQENGDVDFAACRQALLLKKFKGEPPDPAAKRRTLYQYGY